MTAATLGGPALRRPILVATAAILLAGFGSVAMMRLAEVRVVVVRRRLQADQPVHQDRPHGRAGLHLRVPVAGAGGGASQGTSPM